MYRRFFFAILLVTALSTLIFGCDKASGSQNAIVASPTPVSSFVASYKPPLVPIKISYDFPNGIFKVQIDQEFRSPIGTFGISGGLAMEKPTATVVKDQTSTIIAPSETIPSTTGRKLIIDGGGKRQIYEINPNTEYHITIDTKGADEINFDLTKNGDIHVQIPDSRLKEIDPVVKEKEEANKINNELEIAWKKRIPTSYCTGTPCCCYKKDACECVPAEHRCTGKS